VRTDDRIVGTISRWLAGHLSDDELRRELGAVDLSELGADQAEAVHELLHELEAGSPRPTVQMIARETIEAVALGV
jgi:broad specificity phosphatase PhoE